MGMNIKKESDLTSRHRTQAVVMKVVLLADVLCLFGLEPLLRNRAQQKMSTNELCGDQA
jgi:hypothetical protein